MANKTTREPITTAEQIIEWAEKTRDANGEAFTMLNKEEQLLMAKFILAMRDHIKTLQNGVAQSPKADEAKADTPPSEPTANTEEVPEINHGEIIERVYPDKRQTNIEFFKANNISMQRAFQLYQTWADVEPASRMIIDEKRKAYIKSASFAFWLHLPHES